MTLWFLALCPSRPKDYQMLFWFITSQDGRETARRNMSQRCIHKQYILLELRMHSSLNRIGKSEQSIAAGLSNFTLVLGVRASPQTHKNCLPPLLHVVTLQTQ